MFPLLFLLDFSAPVDLCRVIQAAFKKSLFMRCGNVMALDLCEFVFGVSHIPGAYTILDQLFWVRLGALKSHYVLLRCVWFPCSLTTIRRTSSRLFRCAMFACGPMPFPFSHLHPLGRSLSHDRLGLPLETPLATGR